MSKLSAFLKPVRTEIKKEIVISDRFVDEKGEPAKVTIKAITQEENNRLIKASTTHKKEKGQIMERLDKNQYRDRLMVACVVEPDFSQKELLDAYGLLDPLSLPSKMFIAGEYAKLTSEIMDINGFNDDEETLVEEAKN